MSNIWLPVPVALFVRRVVNVLSSLSITHHYLLPSRSSDPDPPELVPQWVASGRLSLPWFRWPTRLSLFNPAPRSINYVQQSNDSTRREESGHNHNSDPNHSCPPSQDFQSPGPSANGHPIHKLMQNPVLYDPLRPPRYPIVLCHGLYGFDVLGPSSLRMHYWSSVLNILRKTVGAEVIVTAVPGTGSIASRAEQLDRFLQVKALGRGINFMAHSMGGLDCRHLITHLKPMEYTPLSLTTIATPHRGSPFMDWCKEYLGLGRRRLEEEKWGSAAISTVESMHAIDVAPAALVAASVETSLVNGEKETSLSPSSSTLSFASLPSSFTTFLLGMFDSPAYANLTTSYLTKVFNPRTPDDKRVRYFSVAGRMGAINIWHPLWLPKLVLDSAAQGEGGNDGLVSVQSAQWGEFLGTLEGADHWTLEGRAVLTWGQADWGRITRAFGRSVESRAEKEKEEKRLLSGSVMKEDEGIKSSTDRLSAVFDWLVEQVPVAGHAAMVTSSSSSSPPSSSSSSPSSPSLTSPHKPRGDLESKGDLERLYVALARKLYDEGL
ncbi:Alpha/Beta hydrolase protein [Multifurca ochricompacta]|uniref:Alpha/Beta hydrolase protein n=1 Tax=Multifurca ochricompacta TaxID=376703 RepID=A0AAD4LW03_9AGAM|nr:Alpha/Beta hydrolase protein [Multifurca ochricompacta]